MPPDTVPHLTKLNLCMGGVLRCCVATWQDAMVTENEGDILPCRYCKHRLIVKDHIWQWDSEYQPEEKFKSPSILNRQPALCYDEPREEP